jgi:hypothetical protein
MGKKLTSLIVSSALVLFLCSTSIVGGSNGDKATKSAEKVKAGIAKLGTGPSARVEVKLRDKRKLKGYISEISYDHFVVNDTKGIATTVAYPQVKQVKGNNLSTGAKITIGIGVVALLVLWAFAVSDPR